MGYSAAQGDAASAASRDGDRSPHDAQRQASPAHGAHDAVAAPPPVPEPPKEPLHRVRSRSRSIGDSSGGHDARFMRMATQCRMSQVCSCGNHYKPDAMFCRKCGKEREATIEGEIKPLGKPIWSWSSANVAMQRRSFWNCWRQPPMATRFLDRDGPFGQSTGNWNVQHWADTEARRAIRRLYWSDAYHSFLDGSLMLQLLTYTVMYVMLFLLFAPIFYRISDRCNLQITSFGQAYYLSLETMVTIGYGVPDQYYNDCWEGAVVLTVQSLVQMFLNAVVIGSVFVRITRPQARGNTILFSEKAVIHEIDGSLYFMFQACETKHHDLLEAHVRCYCIRYDRTVSRAYQIFPMRLQHPDDQQGAALLMSLPSKVVHRIDAWSPLSPTSCYKEYPADVHSQIESAFNTHAWPEVPQRQVDADGGIQSTMVCKVCGDSFPTMEGLRRHVNYNAAQDPANGVPEERQHRPWCADHENLPESMTVTRQDIEDFLASQYIEVVVLLEGVEPTTSCSVQARHSYLFPEDIVWDRTFADCIELGTDEHACAVDLGRFHDLVALDPDEFASPHRGSTLPNGPNGMGREASSVSDGREKAAKKASERLSKLILGDSTPKAEPKRLALGALTQPSIRQEKMFQKVEAATGDEEASEHWARLHLAPRLFHVGWSSRQPQELAVELAGYDATEEFYGILDEIREGTHEVATRWDMTYLFVPGLFRLNWKHAYLRFMLTHLHSLGLDARIAKLDTTLGVVPSAERLVRIISELHAQTGKRLLLIGHSKGACDAISAVSRFKQSVEGKVAGIVCLNAPICGSALAGSLSEPILDATTTALPRVAAHLLGPEVASLEDLSHDLRRAEMEQFPFPYDSIPVVTFSSGASTGDSALAALAQTMRRHAPDGALEEKCDGVVFAADAHLPGSVRIFYREDWDHVDAVYERPEGASQIVIEAAILTLLRCARKGPHKSRL